MVRLYLTNANADTNGQVMHQGVIRDMEQQQIKKERQADFDLQRKMEEEYRKIQRVGDGKDPAGNRTGSPKG